MTVEKPKRFSEVALLLEPLQTQLNKAYDDAGYPLNDVRGSTFLTCKMVVMNNLMILNLIASMEDRILPINWAYFMTGLTNGDIKQQVNHISDYLRLSAATMIQFRIENMFSNLVAILLKKSAPIGYGKLLDDLFCNITIGDKENKKAILSVLQDIRNSLHNNGAHNWPTKEVTIDGITFKFEQGKVVACAGWPHFTTAMKAVIPILVEIVKSPEVMKIPSPVSEIYIK